MIRRNIGLSIFIIVFACACSSLPKREYIDKEMKLNTQETERVWFWGIGDYVKSVMEHVKGYVEPVSKAAEWISWVYVGISGIMFVAGFVCFSAAYLTHMYKLNFVGFLGLIGAGTAAGFAEFANWWWTVPATGIAGALVWFITHRNRHFSLLEWCSNLWRGNDDNN